MNVLVVADDVTGANATGAAFAAAGWRTVSVRSSALDGDLSNADVVVVSTDSRHLAPDRAGAAVTTAIEAVGDVDILVKRVDTTLRGNVAAEVTAALAARRRRHPGARALVAPAFPAAGRSTIGGLQLLDGVPVSDTEAGRDPMTPVRSSRVADLLGDLQVGSVGLADVTGDIDALADALDDGADGVVVDAMADLHLQAIAAAAGARARAGQRWLVVDSGPLGPLLTAAAAPELRPDPGALLVVGASPTARTRTQLDVLERRRDAVLIDIDPRHPDPARADALVAAAADGHRLIGVRTSRDADDVRTDVDPAAVVSALAELARRTIASTSISGAYLTGGDLTAAVIDAMAADALAIESEVLPLAVLGHLMGGTVPGLPVVSKGGLIGDENAALTCIDALRTRTDLSRHLHATGGLREPASTTTSRNP